MTSTFGADLRRRRLAAGLSLNDLASRIHYSKGYLSRLETGARPAGPDVARRCDAALDAGGALAALAGRRSAGHRPTARPPADPVVEWVVLVGDGDHPPGLRRRDLLPGGMTPAPRSPASLAAVAAERSTAAGFAVLLEDLRAMGQVRPACLLLPTLVVQVQTVVALARSAPASRRPALLTLAARFAEYTGWLAQEAGDDAAMTWWTAQAVRLAADAGCGELSAYSHVRHANVALYRGDPEAAVDLARGAVERVAAARTTPEKARRVMGLARQREAQGFAMMGERDDCLRALDRAQDLFDDAADPRRAEALGTTATADPGDLALGWCLHDLGRSEGAVPALERHFARIPPTARRARSRVGGRLALAQAAVGDVESACATADAVLDDAVHVDSATLRHELRRLGRDLRRWRHRSDVQHVSVRVTQALAGHVQLP